MSHEGCSNSLQLPIYDIATGWGSQDGEPGKPPTRLTVRQLGVRIWDYLIGQIILYMVSLSIFPGFLYEDTGTHDLGSWYVTHIISPSC